MQNIVFFIHRKTFVYTIVSNSLSTNTIILWQWLKYLYLIFALIYSTAGGSMFGDVNISEILDSFSHSYDKRVRPNYGGKNHRKYTK